MFLECVGGIACCGYLLYKNNEDFFVSQKIKSNVKKEWAKVVAATTGINSLENFKISHINVIPNGVELFVTIPLGKKYEDLETRKEMIRDNFKCICEMENIRFSNQCKLRLTTKDIGKYEFVPVKTYPNKLFIAREFNADPYFVDLDKEGHMLIAGQTGTGKSFVLASILTNLIASCGDYVEIYLSQIMKGEIGVFAKCKPVKSVQYNLAEVASTLTKVAKIVDDRSKLFTSKGVKNLTHYNTKIQGRKLKRIFYVIEEVSFFIPNKDLDSEEVFKLKTICWDAILTIAKAGRSAGVHFMSVTQRSTVANVPSEVKAQMCCMTMKQRSGRDSENIIDVPDAKDLQDRECLVWGRNGLKLLKVPFIDEDFQKLKKFVPEIIVPGDDVSIETPAKTINKNTEEVKFEHILLEDYNRIQEKKTGIVEVIEVEKVEEVKEEVKKPRGRKRKGAIAE